MKQYLLYDGAGQLVAAGDTPEETVNVCIARLKAQLAAVEAWANAGAIRWESNDGIALRTILDGKAEAWAVTTQ